MPNPNSRFARHYAVSVLSLLLASISIFATPAISQTPTATGTLVGAVTAKSAAVSNVTVTATNKNNGQVRTAKTNSDGQFVLPGLTPGEYTVKVSVEGFAQASRDVFVQVGGASSLNFDLDVLPVGSTLFGTIKGTIRDDKGIPIADASIEFISTDGSDSVTENSSADGAYSRAGLRAGTCDLVAKAKGYLQSKKRVRLGAHEQKTVDFQLKPTP